MTGCARRKRPRWPARGVLEVGVLSLLCRASTSAAFSIRFPPPRQPRVVTPTTPAPVRPTSSIDLDSAPPDVARLIRERPWRAGLEPGREVELTRIPQECIVGKLPADLVGTYFRNGPGRIRVGARRYGHWFDGDGFVAATTFTADGSVFFRQRYLRTEKFKSQLRAGEGRLEPRGVWTQREKAGGEPGDWVDNVLRIPSNPLNTNVLVVGGKALALCEGGPPFEFDPLTLELGKAHTFHGRLKSFFSAHPKADPDTGMIYNQGISLGLSTGLHVMKISPEGRMLKEVSLKLGELVAMHDATLAGPYYVVFVSPYFCPYEGMASALMGVQPLGATYAWHPSINTRVLVFDKEDLSLVQEISMPAVSMYHFINAHSLTPDHGVIEVVLAQHRGQRERVERGFADMYSAHFTQDLECEAWRYVFDVSKGTLLMKGPAERARTSPGFELPTVNPLVQGKPSRYAYVNSLCRDEGLVDSISKVDFGDGGRFESHVFGEGRFAGEAVFVPRKDARTEDDGYLLTYCFDSNHGTSELLVIDAKVPSAKPVCRIMLPSHVPYGFHGTFTPLTFGL